MPPMPSPRNRALKGKVASPNLSRTDGSERHSSAYNSDQGRNGGRDYRIVEGDRQLHSEHCDEVHRPNTAADPNTTKNDT